MPTQPITKPYSIPGFRISLVREPGVKLAERPQINDSAAAARLFAEYFGESDREIFAMAMLSVRNRVLGISTVSVGCLTASLVHPRELFRTAILGGAAALLIAHCHPSGDPEPSAEDLALTRRLKSAGDLLGIAILDHIIVGELGRFVSLRERGAV